jgi:zinc transporter 7
LSSGETTSNGLASALTGLKPAALLNLGADALHNFTDGLAIAVACQRGSAMAVSTILAVAVHELPHEIGDFAVLVQQGGFTKRGAFMAQWVSALGAFAGCVVGLEYGKESPLFVLGFTAGGFLYISLVNIMPDMLSQRPSMGEAAAQVVFMGLGIGMMVFVALYCE